MYASLTDADFRTFYAAALAARTAGTQIVKWTAGDTGVEKRDTLNWTDPHTWAQIDAEYRIRFGAKRTVRRRAQARYVGN